MDFGLQVLSRDAATHPDGLKRLAQAADHLGFGYLGISDHIIIAQDIKSTYPYSESGTWTGVGAGLCLDQLSCLSYAAAVTDKIRLLTSVMVVPHRPAILTAKMLATADFLSNGRVTVGVGVGWMAEEMAALGSPPFEKRGAASNEYIAAFRALWREAEPTFDGEFVKFHDVVFAPKPVQKGGPPIWVGGEGAAARRRAGTLGDGWYPTIRNPKDQLDTPEKFAKALGEVHRHAESAGRDPSTLDVAMFATGCSVRAASEGRDGERLVFTGTAEEVADDARAFAKAGVRHVVIGLQSADLADHLEHIAAFAEGVMPLMR